MIATLQSAILPFLAYLAIALATLAVIACAIAVLSSNALPDLSVHPKHYKPDHDEKDNHANNNRH
jgi:hypothetical protein